MANISVLVPAHNEASVVGRCLDHLLAGAVPGELDVVVVSNGSTDDTVAIANTYPNVRVIALDHASKTAAINAADDLALCFPRVVLDADVVLTRRAIQSLADHMEQTQADAAAPRMEWPDTSGRDLVSRFLRVWRNSVYFDIPFVGAGLYALSESGWRRVAPFPAGVSDDMRVSATIGAAQRTTETSGSFTPSMPSTLRELLRVQTRQRALIARTDVASEAPTESRRSRLRQGVGSKYSLLDAIVYLAIRYATLAAGRLLGGSPFSVPWWKNDR